MASAKATPLAGIHGGPLDSNVEGLKVGGKSLVAYSGNDPKGKTCSTVTEEEQNGKKTKEPCLAIVPYTGTHQGTDGHILKISYPEPSLIPEQGLSSPYTNCRDCGNRAKKDCHHQRCRTCCRKRGFSCPTHVESTWVSSAKRREKHEASVGCMPQAKKNCTVLERDGLNGAISITPTSAGTSPRDSDINPMNPAKQNVPSSTCVALHDECSTANIRGNLPPEVRTFAVFKCVRVTGIADEHDEFAYRATVEIGGRIFKGVLYDQDTEKREKDTDLQLEGKRVRT